MSLFKSLIVFTVGVYAGIYLDQTFKIPRMDDPRALYDKVLERIEQYRKDDDDDKKS